MIALIGAKLEDFIVCVCVYQVHEYVCVYVVLQ